MPTFLRVVIKTLVADGARYGLNLDKLPQHVQKSRHPFNHIRCARDQRKKVKLAPHDTQTHVPLAIQRGLLKTLQTIQCD